MDYRWDSFYNKKDRGCKRVGETIGDKAVPNKRGKHGKYSTI